MAKGLRARRELALSIALVMVLSLFAVFQDPTPANAGHPPGSCLDVEPETETNPVGTSTELIATLRDGTAGPVAPSCDRGDDPVAATAATVINFEITGPNDPEANAADRDGEFSPDTPDLTCTIATGQSSCTASYVGEEEGTDEITGFIEDGEQPTAAEDVDESPTPPDPLSDEPNEVDTVQRTWTPVAERLDCVDESGDDTEVNPSTGTEEETSETYTCTLTGSDGKPFAGSTVQGENESGANDPDNSTSYTTPDYGPCQTNARGVCVFEVRQVDDEAGTAQICFFEGTPAQGASRCGAEPAATSDNNDLADRVQKTWEARRAARIDVNPETDVNELGQQHAFQAIVSDQFGNAFTGSATRVDFEFFQGSPTDNDGNTPSSPDLSCTTPNGSSACSVVYTQTTTVGIDLVCGFVGAPPAMSGSNAPTAGSDNTAPGGNCNGESRSVDAENSNQVDVVQKEWRRTSSTLATRLDCNPEADINPAGTTHEITCVARDAQGFTVANANIDVEATGANDPDGVETFTSPDFSCFTDAEGSCSVLHGPQGATDTSETGSTRYRAWIDRDGNNATVEADRAESREQVDNDGTDVVEKAWTEPPTSLTIDPQSDTAFVGECNPYTITATDASGQPAQGTTLEIEQIHELARNSVQGDEPTVRFCTPDEGPNPSAVDTTDSRFGGPRPAPSPTPGSSPSPSSSPTGSPTASPTGSPTASPTGSPTASPTGSPTASPTGSPTASPTGSPTASPTGSPTASPSPSASPTPAEDPNDLDDNRGTASGETEKFTDGNGQVTIGIAVSPGNGSDGSGRVDLTAFFDRNDNNLSESGEPRATAVKNWISAAPGGFTIDCTPDSATTSTEDFHTVTCTVRDQEGDAEPNQEVTFTESGPGRFTSPTQVKTDAAGQARATVASEEEGTQSISATLTNSVGNNEAECRGSGGQCSDTVINVWEDPDQPADNCPGFADDSRNQVVGTEDDDTLSGTDGDDIICGLGGNDLIDGQGGDDIILGGDGNDSLRGGDGNDDIFGEAGKDELRGNGGNDELIGGDQNDDLRGNAGNDVMRGQGGFDVLRGGGGDDRGFGGSGNDTLQGFTGDDLLVGNSGNDTIKGGTNGDTLRGGKDNDVISGGKGPDKIRGGAGRDVCSGGPGRNDVRGCED